MMLFKTPIATLLADKAITLRIAAGSQEAGFLAAYCPISVLPTVVIIHNGQLVAHLRAGLDLQEFKTAIFEALSQPRTQDGRHSVVGSTIQEDKVDRGRDEPPSGAHSQHASGVTEMDRGHLTGTEASTTSSSTPLPPRAAPVETTNATLASSTLQRVMEDRRRRLEADKAAKDAAETERRKAVAQARREAADAASGTPLSKQSLYAQEQRKRKQEAKAERERILRQIENDKAERKEKEAQRRALAKVEAAEAMDAEEASDLTDRDLPKNWASATQSQQCSLQVRLFNGATIRGKFAPEQTLGNDVRTWIAEQRTDGDSPFTLKQILTPMPNKTIAISEEEESLQSLSLLPSATLVMVPIQGYTGAYPSDQGMVGRAVSAGYNAASFGGSMLKGAMGTFFGFGRATPSDRGPATEEQSPEDSSSTYSRTVAEGEGVKFRTLRRQGEGDTDHQLYNGNQVWEHPSVSGLLCSQLTETAEFRTATR
ncbi:MAG: hypothetical protein Q9181_001102 [Wetmoreana brouardii]